MYLFPLQESFFADSFASYELDLDAIFNADQSHADSTLPSSASAPDRFVGPFTDLAPVDEVATALESSAVLAHEVATVPDSSPAPALDMDTSPSRSPTEEVNTPKDQYRGRERFLASNAAKSYHDVTPSSDTVGFVRIQDFKRHMRVIHNRPISSEEAHSYQEIHHTSDSSRTSSASYEPQQLLSTANSYPLAILQTGPAVNHQPMMNSYQGPLYPNIQPLPYTEAVGSLPGPNSGRTDPKPTDFNNPQELIQLLNTKTYDNQLLHQHVATLRQQMQRLSLERDRYATGYMQIRQENQNMRAYIQQNQYQQMSQPPDQM
ncbi:hypothetical protein HD806DRAFT_538787 [Xylariaceae sp. AK1471]|nr:hypothetical protein HD806DRAFT_538787 [Xylariaceae sp. AK1471]